jgi:hypothetical protein
MWTRQSVNNLNNANLPGPPGDYLNDQATMFLYAGDKHAGENSTGNAVMTVLTSPEFLVEEHPIECFSFWFYFGVSTQKLCLYIVFCPLCTGKSLSEVLIFAEHEENMLCT